SSTQRAGDARRRRGLNMRYQRQQVSIVVGLWTRLQVAGERTSNVPVILRFRPEDKFNVPRREGGPHTSRPENKVSHGPEPRGAMNRACGPRRLNTRRIPSL
ncbi:unnamed protein product, partial [Ectocarpus sp. 12 AP-2014]